MTAVCPWCSQELSEGATVCPSCGANLVPEADTDVPGVTAVDAASIIRSKAAPQSRNRLLSWISGEYTPDVPSKAEAEALALPDKAVRDEILRLELEAAVANLQAEADALRAEAVAEGRTIEAVDEPAAADDGPAETDATEASGAATETEATAAADTAADTDAEEPPAS
jgi:hypothetical protein